MMKMHQRIAAALVIGLVLTTLIAIGARSNDADAKAYVVIIVLGTFATSAFVYAMWSARRTE